VISLAGGSEERDAMARDAMPLVERLRAQARKVLEAVQRQIRDRESELDSLREQASRWLAAIGGEAPRRRGRPSSSGAAAKTTPVSKAPRITSAKVATKPKKRTSPPVDWDKVLGRLPRAFTMKELERATPALNEHRQTRNIALARWSRSGTIKKTGDGKYRKVGRAPA
jgi:hypothetical protein